MTARRPDTSPVVCLDGHAGAGKSTIAEALAERLSWHTLDSGGVYRRLAAESIGLHVPAGDGEGLSRLALDVDFGAPPGPDVPNLRSEEVGRTASVISALPEVRRALLRPQRDARRPPGLVAEGRDMGTTVFPDAILKIFLDAPSGVRAGRRVRQLRTAGVPCDPASVLRGIVERDGRDSSRTSSPTSAASDAVTVETGPLSPGEVVAIILSLAFRRGVSPASRPGAPSP